MKPPVLLDASIEGSNLILRIDLDPESEHSAEAAIRLLTIRNCPDLRSCRDDLQKGIGKTFEYEMFSTENVLSFSSDYREDIELPCDGWTEKLEPATISDLLHRAKYLANRLRESAERFDELYRSHEQLRASLRTAVNQGRDRADRKLAFFEGNNSLKAEAIKAQRQVYEHFRRILEGETKA